MSRRHVVVIGAGAAGLAAAFTASASAKVTLVDGGPGATSFSSGALDATPWDERRNDAVAPLLDASADALIDALGIWSLAAPGMSTQLATVGGTVREARGHDRSLLDLTTVVGCKVLVPRAPRQSWDADALARAWTAAAAPSLDLMFEAVDADVLRFDDERRIADGEIASRHDADERLGWLAAQLRRAIREDDRPIAFVVGPWLGSTAPRAHVLSELVGRPVGEALSGHGTAPGLRFESARARVARDRGIEIVSGRVETIERKAGGLSVTLRDQARVLSASSVVLAIGGLTGGGVVYDPPDRGAGPDGAIAMRAAFELSLSLPTPANVGAQRDASSLHGPVLDEVAWPVRGRASALERVGVFATDPALAGDLFVAGDVVADRPRTMLEALVAGAHAGSKAVAGATGVRVSSSPASVGIPRPA